MYGIVEFTHDSYSKLKKKHHSAEERRQTANSGDSNFRLSK